MCLHKQTYLHGKCAVCHNDIDSSTNFVLIECRIIVQNRFAGFSNHYLRHFFHEGFDGKENDMHQTAARRVSRQCCHNRQNTYLSFLSFAFHPSTPRQRRTSWTSKDEKSTGSASKDKAPSDDNVIDIHSEEVVEVTVKFLLVHLLNCKWLMYPFRTIKTYKSNSLRRWGCKARPQKILSVSFQIANVSCSSTRLCSPFIKRPRNLSSANYIDCFDHCTF